MSRRRIVITGMGVVSPLGITVDGFWERLLAGESGVGPIQRFPVEGFDVRFGGECREFQPEAHLERKDIKRMDRFTQLAVVAARAAFNDCGLDKDKLDPSRVGVITGSGIGGLLEIEEQHLRLIEKGPSKVSAFTIPKLMVNAASGSISIMLGAKGPNTAVATACASATNAIGDALHAIRRNDADIMVTGGAEAALTPLGLAAFASMKALSERNDAPAKASRPFDRDRDGFVMGEGAGMFIFEELEHAKKRGARIYAEILGYGMSADANHITQPDELGRGGAAAMTYALKDAQLSTDQVDYVNAHGTGTPLGDVAETMAIKSVFGDHAKRLRISSTKSSIGHLLGASGGVELVATVMALVNGTISPTINLESPGDGCDLNYTPLTAQDAKVEIAISNSFGFGGHNACVAVSKLS
ncbi:MAG: beta-ketoacyl-ACP synthase II [Planctomycetia bacterium]|nr:beta-ketoacyl-ACP synthase II [Planctomycetia bacterium]MCC7315006.1 beta-ketoacyl-ACP synthase II [Planctomycetota bacterium]OQY99147.1 MAG: beta-ketoacyl-[acyl-carrier-protein] synthase II [Planctomycetes bacterium UTPLA1]